MEYHSQPGPIKVGHRRASRYLLALTSGFGTLQFVFALLASYGTTYLLSTGLSQSAVGLAWLAGPLAGTFVQPIVGLLRDRYGHGQTLIMGGVIMLVIGLLALGWAPDLLNLGKRGPLLGKTVAIAAIVTLNIATQPVQLGLRTLLIEHCPPEQQTMAAAWASRMTGAGNIVAQFAGTVDTRMLSLFLTGSQFKNLCLITAGSLMLTAVILAFLLHDESTTRFRGPGGSHSAYEPVHALRSAWNSLPRGVIGVWKVQFFSWMGWFSFLFYAATYMETLDDVRNTAPKEVLSRNLQIELLHVGPRAMFFNACVSFIASLLLPAVLRVMKAQNQTTTLLRLWLVAQVLFGVCMIGLFCATTTGPATALMGVLGLCWTCTGWIPQALISGTIAQHLASTDEVVAEPKNDDEDATATAPGAGFVMSLHNVSIASPQIPAALVASLILATVPETRNPLAYILLVGGLCGWVGGGMILGVDSMELGAKGPSTPGGQ